jgi:tripartite-type tricarboxylate transporter receptor subunit TctC
MWQAGSQAAKIFHMLAVVGRTSVRRHPDAEEGRAMKRTVMHVVIAAGLMAFAAGFPQSACAQYYKGKTITMIVNYPPGGPTDIEGRIVAQHLPQHVPGQPTVVVKNVGGGSGLLGSNELGDATPDGSTIGFFTLDVMAELTDNPSVRTHFSDFMLIAGVESPLVVYIRKDTPPGINVSADLMKAHDFKALSLNAQNINSINQEISLDLLGIKYQAVPAYRGLKEVETAILQNTGQMANTSLSGWLGSAEPSMKDIVVPLWQLAPRGRNGDYPRSRSLPNMPTFEEFYASVIKGGKPLTDDFRYQAMRAASDPQLAMFRVAVLPPKSTGEAVTVMRTAFDDLWKDQDFLNDYSRVLATQPIMVSGSDGQQILVDLGKVPRKIKDFLIDYTTRITEK